MDADMSVIVHRGSLTKARLAELAQEHFGKEERHYNPNEVRLVKQDDGNWKGWGTFHGRRQVARSFDPSHVLTALITNQGEDAK